MYWFEIPLWEKKFFAVLMGLTVMLIAGLILWPMIAFGQTVDPATVLPKDDASAIASLLGSFKSITEGSGWAVMGPILAAAFYLLRKYDTMIPKIGGTIDSFLNKDIVAFMAPFVIAMIAGVGHALASGGGWPSVQLALIAGLKIGGEAVVTYIAANKLGMAKSQGQIAADAVVTKTDAITELKAVPPS